MKGCLLVLGIVAVMVGGFVLVLSLGARQGTTGDADYTAAADEVQVVSSTPETRFLGSRRTETSGLQTEYVYLAGAQWYAADAWVRSLPGTFIPEDGSGIVRAVCYDPDDPAEHGLLLTEGAECGDGNIGRISSSEGKPTSAP